MRRSVYPDPDYVARKTLSRPIRGLHFTRERMADELNMVHAARFDTIQLRTEESTAADRRRDEFG